MKAIGILLLMSALLCRAQEKAEVPVLPKPLEQPPQRPGLEITADLSVVSLKENSVYYSNNVVVVDPPARPGDPATIMHCRELTANRTPGGEVDKIIASGDVELDRGDLHARGQKAVYSGATDSVTLTGPWPKDPWFSPKPLLFSTNGTTTGTEIIYDRIADKLFVKDPSTYIPPSALGTIKAPATNSIRGTNASSAIPKPQTPP